IVFKRNSHIVDNAKIESTDYESESLIKQPSVRLATYLSIKGLQPEVVGDSLKFKYMNRNVLVKERKGFLSIELYLPFRGFYNAMGKTRKAVQHYMQSSAVDDELVCSLTVPVFNAEKAIDSILETKVKRCVVLYEEIALQPFNAMCRDTVRMMIKQFLIETGQVIDIDVFMKDCPNPFKMDLAVAFSDYLEEVYAIRFLPENINKEGHPKLETVVNFLSVYVNQETPYVLSKRIMQ
ncbi:MAG: hypothetical protein ACI4AE_00970, partial [Candidatus Cryptobacteroides sp.]